MAIRLDAHQHFWRYNESDYSWMGDNTILKQDYLPAHSQPNLRDNGLHGVVAIQARQVPAETDFLLSLQEDNAFIRGVVGWTDLTADNALATLSRYQGKVCGFRHQLEDEPAVDYMLDKKFRRGIRMLSDFNYTFDLLVRPEHLEDCLSLVDEFPEQSFVIDHLAKPDYTSGFTTWSEGIGKLADRDNVFCKVSGMVTEVPAPEDEDELGIDPFIPYFNHLVERFSPDRLMYGSDWPVCSLAATYDEVYDIVSLLMEQLSIAEQDAIMGETAARFYNIPLT